MLSVVCLNWFDYLSRGDEYVSKMQSMVRRHLTIQHEFVVVTERDLPVGREGWFNKLNLLTFFNDEVLYVDLDCVISGNIDHLVEFARRDPSKIFARNDWSYPVTGSAPGRERTVNSSVLLWSGRKDMSGITEKMLAETHGDQGIITQLFWPHGLALLPNEPIKSWKYDALEGRGYGDICVMHGHPKPHEIDHEFVRANWR